MSSMRDADDLDVVISGLGPTGLTLAHLLGKRGLKVLVLEREPKFYGNARAVYTDDECMRIFQSIDLADELAADMLQDTPVQMLLPDNSVLLQIKDTKRVFGWAPANFFYQPHLETRMGDALDRYPNVSVQRGREVTSFEQDRDGVSVFHIGSQGTGYGKPAPAADKQAASVADGSVARARYFVACDGGRSIARTQLGIEMTGKSFPNPWLVVDIRQKDGQDGLRHLPYFNFVCDPACPTVSCTQPDGHHRFEFMLMPGQTREYMEDPATIRRYLSRHVDVDKFEILRSVVYTFNALIAERWRADRVFLAGDAAHMTPQFIGQGMNAGVRDAYNLAWKLDAVMKGVAGERLLDTYQTERRPHVHDMIKTAVQMKDFVSVANPLLALVRNVLTRVAKVTPVVGRIVQEGAFIPQPAYASGSYFGLPRSSWRSAAGRMMPQPSVRGVDGKRHLLDQLLGNGPAVIGAGVDPRRTLGAAELATLQSLRTCFAIVFPFGGRPQGKVDQRLAPGLVEIEDIDGTYFDWLRSRGATSGSVAIVRPDRFVFGLVRPEALPAATRSLALQLGRSGTTTPRASPVHPITSMETTA